MIEANALILHFNALQEALQPEGNTRFSGLLSQVEKVCRFLSVPVIAKEVGWGFSVQDASRLRNAGVSAIDIAGAGGTSWSEVEKYRSPHMEVHDAFRSWGIPTARSLTSIRTHLGEFPLIASGGIRSGVDAVKCLGLGASLVGLALPFLRAASVSEEALESYAKALLKTCQTAMFCIGARTVADTLGKCVYRCHTEGDA